MTFNNAAVSDWAQKVQSQHLQRTELSWEGTGNLLGKWGRVNSLMEPEMERGVKTEVGWTGQAAMRTGPEMEGDWD